MDRFFEKDIELLHSSGCSCVIRNGDSVRVFRQRGVKDLYDLLHREPEFLSGARVTDKVVGKGAAALMVLGGVEQVYADVMSEPAAELFRRAGVAAECAVRVPNIINRAGTGICPVEQRCAGLGTAEECLVQIEDFLGELQG